MRGFTIVEVMVGLVLGMIGIIIMFQVFEVFEGQRRTTVAGGNTQTAGHLAMYNIERQARLAGLGLVYVDRPEPDEYRGLATCPLGIRTYSGSSGGLSWLGGATMAGLPVAPVQVRDGGANPDSFTIVFGPSALGGVPATLNAPLNNAGGGPLSLAEGIKVESAPFVDITSTPPINAVYKPGDIILIGEPGPRGTDPAKHCVRLKVTEVRAETDVVSGKTFARLMVAPGSGNDENPPPSEWSSFMPAPDPIYSYANGKAIVTHLATAGGGLSRITYEVNAQQQLLAGGVVIADNVISLQAQYGIGPNRGELGCGMTLPYRPLSEPQCQSVKAWTDAVPFDGEDWGKLDQNPTPLTTDQRITNINRVKAVRLSLVLRSENLERASLYGADREIAPKAACTAAGDIVDDAGIKICAWRDPNGGTAVPLVDPSLATDEAACAAQFGAPCWDRYRYRVYETVVPLRNVIWATKAS
jgi:type IV pilus assembly protein PilW